MASLAKLAGVEGRTAIVLLTDGRDEDNPGTGPGSTASLENVLTRLGTVDATVYAIGLRADRRPPDAGNDGRGFGR